MREELRIALRDFRGIVGRGLYKLDGYVRVDRKHLQFVMGYLNELEEKARKDEEEEHHKDRYQKIISKLSDDLDNLRSQNVKLEQQLYMTRENKENR